VNLLPRSVPTINDDIRARSVARRITRQVHIRSLQLLRLRIPTHRDHALPQILSLLIHKVTQSSIDIARAHTVHTRKVPPLIRKRLGKMDAASLGDIVGSLFLREVGNVAGHRGGDDEGASLALAEVVADCFGAMEGTRQISVDDLFPLLNGGVEDAVVGGLAGVGDEDVDLPEILNHIGNELFHVLPVANLFLTPLSASSALSLPPIHEAMGTHLAFISLALDPVFLRQLLRIVLSSLCTGAVGNSDISAHFGAAAGSFDPDANGAGGSSHDDDFTFEAEELVEGVGFGDFDRHVGGIGGICLWMV